ncbi:protein virilizer homolog, partial [Bombina bombina]
MAGEPAMELLFLDTFKHQNTEQGSNVDVVRFPCVVYINEVRVIPPGVRAHSNLPDSKAYGETSPHTFHLDLFFNNVTKPSATVFDRLGSLEYDENNSIIFRPNAKVNTDGLVLKGWYSCLTLAVYGSVDRVIVSHERESPPPPPPPPPPPQHQQIGLKRNPKHVEEEKEEQFNGSPPRPQPRGPRTPPGPPPPDDDEEDEPMQASDGNKEDDSEQREGYFEPISPDRASIPADDNYSDDEDVEDDHQDDDGDDDEDDEDEDDEEDEDLNAEEDDDEEDRMTGDSIADDDEDEEGDEEDIEGDDGYEQISSDEDGIADFEREAFKYPSFDIEYTPEDLATVPTMAYDPFDRDLGPLMYFSCPYKTAYENEISKLKDQDLDKETSGSTEASLKLTELLDLYQDDRGAKWVTALEEVPSLIVKGLSFLQIKEPGRDHLSHLVDWAALALDLQLALQQPIALNVRQLKAGTKLVSSLAECGTQAVECLLKAGVIGKLYNLLFAEHVSSPLKLNAFKSLDSLISTTEGMEGFLKSFSIDGKSGYQKLLELILLDQTVRVFTACTAILQKCHFYEILSYVKRFGEQLTENTPAPPNHGNPEQNAGSERPRREYDNDVEMTMDMDRLLEASNISEAELEKMLGLLNEIFHLLDTAPYAMVQPPVKSFPTLARITGPPERDDPYPVLFR